MDSIAIGILMLIFKLWPELIELDKLTRLELFLTNMMLWFLFGGNITEVLVFQVLIYRLVTRGTIEERMMEITKKKMVLEHLVVGSKAQNINQVMVFFC